MCVFRDAGRGVFESFGPCRVVPLRRARTRWLDIPSAARAARRLLRRECPERPGVYGFVDGEGQLIYVGKAKSLVRRLVTYFSESADAKAGRIARQARRLVWEPAPHEFIALLRELELIRRFLPRFNSKGRPRRRSRTWLALTPGPAPRAVLAFEPPVGARIVHGPLRWTRRVRRLVRLVNDHFRLRACAERTAVALAEQRELFEVRRAPRCMRRELGLCLAPCDGSCSRADYQRQVRAAADFLAGRDSSALVDLERAMHQAAAGGRFEQAAVARDAWAGLAELHAMLNRLREVRSAWSFVYPVPGFAGREIWFFIKCGQVAATLPGAGDADSARECLDAVEAVYGAEPPDDPDMLLLLGDWFRRYPEELQRVVAPDALRRRLAG